MTKLSALTILLLGISIGIVALSWAFFTQWQPNMTEAQYHREYKDQLEAQAAMMNKAKERVETAKRMVQEKADAWKDVALRKTPQQSLAMGGIDLSVNAWQLVVDVRKFRNSIQRAVNAQLKKGGVTVLSGPMVPFPSESATAVLADYFNYPAFPFPVVIFDFGTVTVRGTYRQITDHIRAWSNMPNYLAVADGLQIQGTSPTLTATYSLSLVAYIRGDHIFPVVPEGAGGGTGPGAGGPGPGGRPGGGARAG